MAPTIHSYHAPSHYYPRRDVAEQLTPNDTQKVTLIVAACYIVAIAILWHVPILEKLIYPFKLLTVGLHEMSHALAGVLTCATVEKITLDPQEGGSTRMRGGIPAVSSYSVLEKALANCLKITLPAGYLGSSFIGACLVACVRIKKP